MFGDFVLQRAKLVSSDLVGFVLLLLKQIDYDLAFRVHHQEKHLESFGVTVVLLNTEQVLEDEIHLLGVEIDVREVACFFKVLERLQEMHELLSHSVISYDLQDLESLADELFFFDAALGDLVHHAHQLVKPIVHEHVNELDARDSEQDLDGEVQHGLHEAGIRVF